MPISSVFLTKTTDFRARGPALKNTRMGAAGMGAGAGVGLELREFGSRKKALSLPTPKVLHGSLSIISDVEASVVV